ncbi:heme lyase CcmF/NrfE family subunit [Desulfuribacillus alkaliarsenatis]|uniref:Cytochrome C biogenesis protein n=1 Tax=Desulfuribacillus alkaliarsenatis TaxID=766136 RepID=A0A1E5FZS7_9FIRM|nr:heme lyase CcmF/NrfE family subunit [Desulfuribacillus alkaliarsenatis]OEF96095.1 cytochrome C biogenesis protein [Desulfuribacillus alkaliarsenatis]
MISQLGYIAILISLALSIYGLGAFLYGVRNDDYKLINSAKGAIKSIALLSTVAAAVLIYVLVTSDFRVLNVYRYTSTDLPLLYKISAFWAGNSGSLMLWAWVLSIFSFVVIFSRKLLGSKLLPYVGIIFLLNQIFFFFVLCFAANPFALNPDPTITEGTGLNPMLQHPGMIFHPVTLYIGYVGFVVPFAFGMAALITKQVDDFWIKMTRKWTVIAWLFLTLGNLYGGQWAYVELGWGGYWAWDPVENASFMPWLTATAFLHSIMIQERKNMLKVWNMVLIILTYGLTLFGTFLVRSGVLTSVHAFADSNIGSYFLLFLTFMMLLAIFFLINNLKVLQEGGQFKSLLSKESSFLVNNLLLVGVTFATFWGTMFPVISEAVQGVRVTVGIPFFDRVNGPLLLAMIFVMGVCPLIAWQKSTLKNLRDNFLIPGLFGIVVAAGLFAYGIQNGWALLSAAVIAFVFLVHIIEFVRGTRVRMQMTNENVVVAFYRLISRARRRYGGYIIHIGIILMAIGIVASNIYDVEELKTVQVGESIIIKDYVLTYEGLNQVREGANDVVYADLTVYKGGEYLMQIQPEKIFYPTWPQPRTEVALHSTIIEDLYVVLSGWERDESATIKVTVNPLVAWIWYGGYIVVLGTIIALWPGRYGNYVPRYKD